MQQDDDFNRQVGLLSSEQDEARQAAADSLSEHGAGAVSHLVKLMSGNDHQAAAGAWLALKKMTHRASAPLANDREEVASALLDEMFMPNPIEVKRNLLRLISFAAQDRLIDRIAELLADPELTDMVCFALLRIGSKSVPTAMAEYLDEVSNERKPDLVLALAKTGDSSAAAPLLKFADHEDPKVRLAAIEGVSMIPDSRVEPVLWKACFEGAASEQKVARRAYIDLAEKFYICGNKEQAQFLFGKVYQKGATDQDRCAGLFGLARIMGSEAIPLLKNTIIKEPLALASSALSVLSTIKTDDAAEAVIDAAFATEGPIKSLLFDDLGMRASDKDLVILLDGLNSEDENLQIAACRALTLLKAPESAPALIDTIQSSSGELQEKAAAALNQLEGLAPLRAILKAVKEKPVKELVLSLGYREGPAVETALSKALDSPEREIRYAAIRALGMMNQPNAAQILIGVLRKGDPEEVDRVLQSVRILDDEGATEAIVKALETEGDQVKVGILTALGEREDSSFANLFIETASSSSGAVAVAALKSLAPLKDLSLADKLLEIIDKMGSQEREEAIRAYILMGDSEEDAAKSLEIYHRGLNLAQDPEGKKLAIKKIGAVEDPAGIPIIKPYLMDENDSIKKAGVEAITSFALNSDAGEAKEILMLVVKMSDNAGAVQKAVAMLRDIGIDVKPPIREGYVSNYWIIGPFPGRDDMLKNDLLTVDKPVDLEAPLSIDNKTYQWKYYSLDHIFGRLNLIEAVADSGDVGVYVYAEAIFEKEQDAALLIGSDDDVYCWLNGEQVHKFEGGRGWRADEDRVDVHLKAGANSFLLKVLNGGGGWDVSLRIVDRNLNPLEFEEKK